MNASWYGDGEGYGNGKGLGVGGGFGNGRDGYGDSKNAGVGDGGASATPMTGDGVGRVADIAFICNPSPDDLRAIVIYAQVFGKDAP